MIGPVLFIKDQQMLNLLLQLPIVLEWNHIIIPTNKHRDWHVLYIGQVNDGRLALPVKFHVFPTAIVEFNEVVAFHALAEMHDTL